jgi:hypothetical protein
MELVMDDKDPYFDWLSFFDNIVSKKSSTCFFIVGKIKTLEVFQCLIANKIPPYMDEWEN